MKLVSRTLLRRWFPILWPRKKFQVNVMLNVEHLDLEYLEWRKKLTKVGCSFIFVHNFREFAWVFKPFSNSLANFRFSSNRPHTYRILLHRKWDACWVLWVSHCYFITTRNIFLSVYPKLFFFLLSCKIIVAIPI